jgi:asparagine synthetase B (glutamine-hydrolysing)
MIRRCKKGLWDQSIPGISFNNKGISNYAEMYTKYANDHPRGEKGLDLWSDILKKIKSDGKKRAYDCLVGVSGGTDSSYLLHFLKKSGLRVLAINLDNGWNSDIALKNIKNITSKLDIDLETYVIDYEEVKKVIRSYMKAGMPWIDGPTDNAIRSILYRTASREKIKYILNGEDFFSEGKQPTEWTYSDARQLLFLVNKFENCIPKSFPYLSIVSFFYFSLIKNIKVIRPLNFLDYSKKNAQRLLKDLYGWEYYGGHHHENIFTKFAIGYWLPKKFNIDKRMITSSARIMNGEISRHEGLKILEAPPINMNEIQETLSFVCKKLDLSNEEFEKIMSSPNKIFSDYPSYYPFIKTNIKYISKILKYFINYKPKMLYEIESRNGK